MVEPNEEGAVDPNGLGLLELENELPVDAPAPKDEKPPPDDDDAILLLKVLPGTVKKLNKKT